MCRLLRLFRKVKLIFFPLVKSIAKGVYLKLLNYLYNYILIKQNMILVIFPQFSVFLQPTLHSINLYIFQYFNSRVDFEVEGKISKVEHCVCRKKFKTFHSGVLIDNSMWPY